MIVAISRDIDFDVFASNSTAIQDAELGNTCLGLLLSLHLREIDERTNGGALWILVIIEQLSPVPTYPFPSRNMSTDESALVQELQAMCVSRLV